MDQCTPIHSQVTTSDGEDVDSLVGGASDLALQGEHGGTYKGTMHFMNMAGSRYKLYHVTNGGHLDFEMPQTGGGNSDLTLQGEDGST